MSRYFPLGTRHYVVLTALAFGACSNADELARLEQERAALATRLDIYRQEKEHLQHYIDLHYDHSGRTSKYVVQMADSMAQLKAELAMRERRIRQLEAERSPEMKAGTLRQQVKNALPELAQRGLSLKEVSGSVAIAIPKTLLFGDSLNTNITAQGQTIVRYLAEYMRNNLDYAYQISEPSDAWDAQWVQQLAGALRQQGLPSTSIKVATPQHPATDGKSTPMLEVLWLPKDGVYQE